MYVEQGLTLQQIADECGATAPTIANDLAALGIPRRRGGAKALYPDPGIRTCACCGGTFTVKPSDAAPRLGAGGQRACFCSHECWGRYRWAQQSISEKLLEQLPPKARQRWMGRRFGGRGAVEGHAGGAPIKATPEQAKQIWELKRAGELSHTAIAVEVFGDRRYRKRVDRIVGRNPLAGGS
ncbi:MAG: hypothetical protein QOJ13_939 [Gaiellales bacterium]|nr:hypothetical protein [Gaiellales bacterium]